MLSQSIPDDTSAKTWTILIQDFLAPISLESAIHAFGRPRPNLLLSDPYIIRPFVGEPPSWTRAAKGQKRLIEEIIAKTRSLSEIRFAIFSLAQIPLAIHLGFAISDAIEVYCFQHDRHNHSWQWPDPEKVQPDLNIETSGLPEEIIEEQVEVVIRVSLSAKIRKQDTDETVPGNSIEVDVFIDNPDVMWLQSPEQLTKLGKVFRQGLASLRERVPNSSRYHLFYAGPTGGAIVIGQQINPRMNPVVDVYEYSRQSTPCYQRALQLE